MKIEAEDKAVESRTTDYLSEWDASKPVEGSLRPEEALRKLNLYETRLAKLKEDRDNVARAKDALELSSPGVVVIDLSFFVKSPVCTIY